MVDISKLAEQRVLLQNISWQFFENLLEELGEKRSHRITYYQGQLEIMTPLWAHENYNRLIDRLIVSLIEELNLEVWMGGSVMLKRANMNVGKEPDSCYYIQNEGRVRGKTDLNFNVDPPPDLVLEIDLGGSHLNQLILYADLNIPEVWRYDGSKIYFYQLNHGAYVECDRSPTFSLLSAAEVHEYLEQCKTLGLTTALGQFRTWIANQL
ncbi:MAG: Uma2 family endonuclease [Moorea sp. SIO2B7]|nr:Uma2 family endonuclease [Moorena sp. SIO2B7]